MLLAGDVLIYIGDLQDLLAAARQVLLPSGVFAFTAEMAADDDKTYELRPSLRYAHGKSYLQKSAAQAGLQVALLQQAPLRLLAAPWS